MHQLAEALLNVPKGCFLSPRPFQTSEVIRLLIFCHESLLLCKYDYCLAFQSFHSERRQLEISALDSRWNFRPFACWEEDGVVPAALIS